MACTVVTTVIAILGVAAILWAAISFHQTPDLLAKNVTLAVIGPVVIITSIALHIFFLKSSPEKEEKRVPPNARHEYTTDFDPYPWEKPPAEISDKEALKKIRHFEKKAHYPYSDRVGTEKEAKQRLKELYKASKKDKVLRELVRNKKISQKRAWDPYPWEDHPDDVSGAEALKRIQQLERHLDYPFNVDLITRKRDAKRWLAVLYQDKQALKTNTASVND